MQIDNILDLSLYIQIALQLLFIPYLNKFGGKLGIYFRKGFDVMKSQCFKVELIKCSMIFNLQMKKLVIILCVFLFFFFV